MQILLIFVLLVLTTANINADVLWVNYDENVYKSDIVTYIIDYMYVISQKQSEPLVLFQELPAVSVKKPIISIMVSSIEENKPELPKDKEGFKTEKAIVVEKGESPSNYTVFFDFNSAKLRSDQINVLNNIQLKGGEIANIYGYACLIGKADYNKKLSKRRAKAVANYLQKRGVAIGEVVGMGETGKEKELRLNRKAVIKFQ